MANRTYEPGSVRISWNGIDLSTGWGEDTFLTIEPLSERVQYIFGADGITTPVKMSNKGATISLTLTQTAEANKDIANVWAAQEVIGAPVQIGAFVVEDLVGDSAHFVTLNAGLSEVPGHSFATSPSEKTWVWVCETYIETSDPSTITSALDQYTNIFQ